MTLSRFILALLFGAFVGCKEHAPVAPSSVPDRTLHHYTLIIDESLPLSDFQRAEKQWSELVPGLTFNDSQVTHEEAMLERPFGRGEYIVIVNADLEPEFRPCPADSLACYQAPGIIYFNADYTGVLGGWRCVPAHELGHAMGLDHNETGIMAKYVEQQPSEPTTGDAWLLSRKLNESDR
jgi:hypothetical protein